MRWGGRSAFDQMGFDLLTENLFAGHAAAAAGSVAGAAFLTHPLDTLKTLLQVGAGSSQQVGLWQVVERVRMVSGLSDGRTYNYVHVSEAFLAGMAAGAMEAVICTPFELLKIRSQVSSASLLRKLGSVGVMQESTPLISKLLPGSTPNMKAWNNTLGMLSTLSTSHIDIVGVLKQYPWMLTGSGRPPFASEVKEPSKIVSLEGWSALWRGLRPGIAQKCVFGGFFFSTWQFFHIAMLDWKALDLNPPPRSIDDVGPVSPLASSLAAGFSGMVAAAASHPFDTAKTRSHCIVTPKYIAMERKLLRWERPGIWLERVTGMSPADRNIMFRGLKLRMLCSGIASFALVGSYLLSVDYLF
ncbi:solute carrier protein FPSE_08119-like isoform X3 [Musa acuminata AAA Group]|uniref:solute carrier protein FPSE_08119-like isoform X3 n=1 Tax=Musa acuminata AAA Group TaxID=214697 RepID=UPI0031E17017